MGGRLTIRDRSWSRLAPRAWQRIARCGTWWNGAQRIAIAAETRNALQCGLCPGTQGGAVAVRDHGGARRRRRAAGASGGGRAPGTH